MVSSSTGREGGSSRNSEQAAARDADVGTMPPSAIHEARTTGTTSTDPVLKANPSLGPSVFPVDLPDDDRSGANGANVAPPETVGGNPLTLGPDDPDRDSDEGQPYLDDANPYGRPLVNRQNRPMGGIGATIDPNDQERPLDRVDTSAAGSNS